MLGKRGVTHILVEATSSSC